MVDLPAPAMRPIRGRLGRYYPLRLACSDRLCMLNPYLYRLRPYPLKLIVDVHAFCNARCTMCPYPRYSRQQSQGFMSPRLYENIVAEFGQMGRDHGFTPTLTYCYMGEIFLAPDVPSLVRQALNEGISVSLNTNAHPMTPDKVDALLAAGFDGTFFISSHSHNPEVYRRIMGLDYETTLNHIEYLLRRYDPQKVLIRGVDDGWPEGEKQRWFDFWQPKGVMLEYLKPVSRCGGVKRLLPQNLKENTQKQEGVRLYGCRNHLPLYEMVILYDGRMVMCCQDMGREVILGNVADDGIAGVWNGPTRLETVRRLYDGSRNSPDFICSKCEYALTKKEMVQQVVQKAWQKVVPARKPQRELCEA